MKTLSSGFLIKSQIRIVMVSILLASGCAQFAKKKDQDQKRDPQPKVEQSPEKPLEPSTPAPEPTTAPEPTPTPEASPAPVPSTVCSPGAETLLKTHAGIWFGNDGENLNGNRCDVTMRIDANSCDVTKITQCDGISKPQVDTYTAVVTAVAANENFMIEPSAVGLKLKESSCGTVVSSLDLSDGLVFELASAAGSDAATIAYETVKGRSKRREWTSGSIIDGLPRNKSCAVIDAGSGHDSPTREMTRALAACHATIGDGGCLARP